MSLPVAPDIILKTPRYERNTWLRGTLRRSQQEAVASSMMTATSDNFFNAYAIFLGATLAQMGFVT
ncbi:MAG: MFS transporter, partial [Shewanella sp.]